MRDAPPRKKANGDTGIRPYRIGPSSGRRVCACCSRKIDRVPAQRRRLPGRMGGARQLGACRLTARRTLGRRRVRHRSRPRRRLDCRYTLVEDARRRCRLGRRDAHVCALHFSAPLYAGWTPIDSGRTPHRHARPPPTPSLRRLDRRTDPAAASMLAVEAKRDEPNPGEAATVSVGQPSDATQEAAPA